MDWGLDAHQCTPMSICLHLTMQHWYESWNIRCHTYELEGAFVAQPPSYGDLPYGKWNGESRDQSPEQSAWICACRFVALPSFCCAHQLLTPFSFGDEDLDLAINNWNCVSFLAAWLSCCDSQLLTFVCSGYAMFESSQHNACNHERSSIDMWMYMMWGAFVAQPSPYSFLRYGVRNDAQELHFPCDVFAICLVAGTSGNRVDWHFDAQQCTPVLTCPVLIMQHWNESRNIRCHAYDVEGAFVAQPSS